MATKTKELKALEADFKAGTQIEVGAMENSTYPHQKNLVFYQPLNCEDMEKITAYIRKTFSTEGTYSHQLPKLTVKGGLLCLSVDVNQIKYFILKEEVNS